MKDDDLIIIYNCLVAIYKDRHISYDSYKLITKRLNDILS